jgi:hypothetical protein
MGETNNLPRHPLAKKSRTPKQDMGKTSSSVTNESYSLLNNKLFKPPETCSNIKSLHAALL